MAVAKPEPCTQLASTPAPLDHWEQEPNPVVTKENTRTADECWKAQRCARRARSGNVCPTHWANLAPLQPAPAQQKQIILRALFLPQLLFPVFLQLAVADALENFALRARLAVAFGLPIPRCGPRLKLRAELFPQGLQSVLPQKFELQFHGRHTLRQLGAALRCAALGITVKIFHKRLHLHNAPVGGLQEKFFPRFQALPDAQQCFE